MQIIENKRIIINSYLENNAKNNEKIRKIEFLLKQQIKNNVKEIIQITSLFKDVRLPIIKKLTIFKIRKIFLLSLGIKE